MNYRDTILACRQCGKAFSWPSWAQEWRVVTGVSALPDYCVSCRLVAAQQHAGAGATAPAPPWDGLPMRTVTHGARAGDPVNFACEGTSEELLAAFAAVGARPADPLSLRDDLRLAEAALLRGVYMSAPVSRLYLFGRVEDFAIETELGSVARRMHARLARCCLT
jgi:hypothetical protein